MFDDDFAWPLVHVYLHDTANTFERPAYVGGAAGAANPGNSQRCDLDRRRHLFVGSCFINARMPA